LYGWVRYESLDSAFKGAQRAATRPSPGAKQERELAVRRIINANIDRFKRLLKTETDATKRAIETRLLAEEEEKLKQLADAKQKKAY
jgi:hypothetical protein